MKLSVQERLQFQFLLPVQGNLKTLETVERIIQKVQVSNMEEPEKEIFLEREDVLFLRSNIKTLDENCKLSFQSLSLIRKIMEEII